MRQNGSNRLRDFWRGKTRGRNLIKKRLKKMVIGGIHNRQTGRRMMKSMAELQPAKASSQNEDVIILPHNDIMTTS